MISAIRTYLRQHGARRIVCTWELSGRPVPPPHAVKQLTVREYARQFKTRVFIETGTFKGDMIEAMRDHFGRLHSIELGADLRQQARTRFARFNHITIHQGDSSAVLKVILAGVHEPCLFWLDGHYSAGITAKGQLNTPILQELDAICAHPVTGHVVLIDDARLFVGRDDYPSLDELRAHIARARPQWEFELQDDIIRIHGTNGKI